MTMDTGRRENPTEISSKRDVPDGAGGARKRKLTPPLRPSCGMSHGRSPLRDYLRRLSGRTEFFIVVLGAFGILLPGSLMYLLVPPGTSGQPPPITGAGLQQLIAYEVIVLTVLG